MFSCRTAAVKHHLRKMADRHEMLSTYEHDFGTPVTLLQEGGTARMVVFHCRLYDAAEA